VLPVVPTECAKPCAVLGAAALGGSIAATKAQVLTTRLKTTWYWAVAGRLADVAPELRTSAPADETTAHSGDVPAGPAGPCGP
jgi:hypothetical protein